MPTTASLPAFLKSCGELHFLLQKAMTDYFAEDQWSTMPRLFPFLPFAHIHYRG